MYRRPRIPSFSPPQTPTIALTQLELINKGDQSPEDTKGYDAGDEGKLTMKAQIPKFTKGMPTGRPLSTLERLLTDTSETNSPRYSNSDVEERGSPSPVRSFEPTESPSVFDPQTADWVYQLSDPLDNSDSASSDEVVSNDSPYNTADPTDGSVLNPSFPPRESTDLILMPNDRNIHFYVHSKVVFAASSVLAKYLAPSFYSPSPEDDAEENLIVIYELEETYEILDAILRFCYPKKKKHSIESISQLAPLLAACRKYQVMTGLLHLSITLIQYARLAASGIMPGSPLECYSLACRFRLHDAVKEISTYCLTEDIHKADLEDVLAGVTDKDKQRLIELHHNRACDAITILDTAGEDPVFHCDGCKGVAEWFHVFWDRARKELERAPVTREIFRSSFTTACLNRAMKKCPGPCVQNYFSKGAQLRLDRLQRDIDALEDTVAI